MEGLVSLAAFASLLEYPGPGFRRRVSETMGGLASGGGEPRGKDAMTPAGKAAAALAEFARWAEEASDASLEETYTAAFDFAPACPLYVGHHVFADPRARTAFMTGLAGLYRTRGFSRGQELPDHLGVMLRFFGAGSAAPEDLEVLVGAVIPAVRAMTEACRAAAIPYAPLLEALGLVLEEAARKSAGFGDGTP